MLNAIILGLIQGLTEFLPVSSSGHVLFFEQILNFTDQPGFAGAIHLATAFAAIIYFRKEIISILKSFLRFRDQSEENKTYRNLGIQIIIATIPAAVLGLIVTKLNLDSYFSSALAIGITSIIFAALLYFSERNAKESKQSEKQDTNTFTALIIGSSQIIAAILPGASRSGVTLTTSFFLNVERQFAAKFIFLISIPITLLASLNEIILEKSVVLNGEFYLAFVAAFLSGLVAIYILLKLINSGALKWLCVYRVVFGIALIVYSLVN